MICPIQANLLLISEQETSEFSGLEKVTHVRESFDPDRTARGILYASSKQKHPALERNNRRMYEDMNYWINCALLHLMEPCNCP